MKLPLIRGYRVDDCRALADLYTDTVWRVASRDYPPAEIAAWAPAPPDYAQFELKLSARPNYVAEREGKIVGFSDLEPDGHIDMMFVHADHQGQGVATALLGHIEAVARGCGLRRLYTEASLTARPFFARRGFTVLARQAVPVRGQLLTNFRMEKRFISTALETDPSARKGQGALPLGNPPKAESLKSIRKPVAGSKGIALVGIEERCSSIRGQSPLTISCRWRPAELPALGGRRRRRPPGRPVARVAPDFQAGCE